MPPTACLKPLLRSFFRNVDSRQGVAVDLPTTAPGRSKAGGGGGDGQLLPIAELRARAVLVDMEEGVVNSILKVGGEQLPACLPAAGRLCRSHALRL